MFPSLQTPSVRLVLEHTANRQPTPILLSNPGNRDTSGMSSRPLASLSTPAQCHGKVGRANRPSRADVAPDFSALLPFSTVINPNALSPMFPSSQKLTTSLRSSCQSWDARASRWTSEAEACRLPRPVPTVRSPLSRPAVPVQWFAWHTDQKEAHGRRLSIVRACYSR